MKNVKKVVSGLTTTVLFLVLIVMVVAVISSKASGGEPNFLGFQLKPVLSGSMEPAFMTGSIISIKPVDDPTSLNKGDVITFMDSEDVLVTHRIIEVIKNGDGSTMYKTQGDNVGTPDANLVLPQNIVGKYTGFTIPKAGYFIEFSQSKNGALLLVIPGILLIVYSAFSILRALREFEKTRSKDIQENI